MARNSIRELGYGGARIGEGRQSRNGVRKKPTAGGLADPLDKSVVGTKGPELHGVWLGKACSLNPVLPVEAWFDHAYQVAPKLVGVKLPDIVPGCVRAQRQCRRITVGPADPDVQRWRRERIADPIRCLDLNLRLSLVRGHRYLVAV